MCCYPDAGITQDADHGEDDQAPAQTELLAENSEDEVGVRLGEAAPLLPAGAKTDSPPAARRNREHAGVGLMIGASEIKRRVQKGSQATHPHRIGNEDRD